MCCHRSSVLLTSSVCVCVCERSWSPPCGAWRQEFEQQINARCDVLMTCLNVTTCCTCGENGGNRYHGNALQSRPDPYLRTTIEDRLDHHRQQADRQPLCVLQLEVVMSQWRGASTSPGPCLSSVERAGGNQR